MFREAEQRENTICCYIYEVVKDRNLFLMRTIRLQFYDGGYLQHLEEIQDQ